MLFTVHVNTVTNPTDIWILEYYMYNTVYNFRQSAHTYIYILVNKQLPHFILISVQKYLLRSRSVTQPRPICRN
jgi:hypothetical protein